MGCISGLHLTILKASLRTPFSRLGISEVGLAKRDGAGLSMPPGGVMRSSARPRERGEAEGVPPPRRGLGDGGVQRHLDVTEAGEPAGRGQNLGLARSGGAGLFPCLG